jgi:hypothetical protein
MSADPERDVPEGAAVFPVIPAELGVDPLLLAVLHAVVFLDGSDEPIVNPDAAEEALDHIAAYLQRLDGPRLAKVCEDLACLSTFAGQQNWPKSQARFIRDFLTTYGVERKGKA